MLTNQTESERRSAVVAAIHFNAGLTGVDAVDNGNGGISIKAVDGRNVSVWFDSNKVNAGSFGLGRGNATNTPEGLTAIAGGDINSTNAATVYASVTLQSDKSIRVESGNNGVGGTSLGLQNIDAVAQITQINIQSTPTVPTVTKTQSYIEIADGGTSSESLIMSTDATPSTTQGALSYVSGVLYRGNGTSADVMGYADATRNGLNGAPLRFNFINPNNQYYNPANQHYYEVVTPSTPVTWSQAKTLAEGKTLFGLNGYLATVTDSTEQNFINNQLAGKEGWIGASDQDVSLGGLGEGNWAWMTGPEAGTEFYQGQYPSGQVVNSKFANWDLGEPNNLGNEDYAYIRGNGKWNDYSGFQALGSYVVEYGGVGFGGSALPSISNQDLQNFQSKVTYSDSAITDTASLNINGLTVTSAPCPRNAVSIATALETAVNAQINSGTLMNVTVQRQGSTLSIKSTAPGTPFQVSDANTNTAANSISVQEVTKNRVAFSPSVHQNYISHFSDLGFYEGTFGGEVNAATAKMSPPRTGRLAIQVGTNDQQTVSIDLADFGSNGPITGQITWDVNLDSLAPGTIVNAPKGPQTLIGVSMGQGMPKSNPFGNFSISMGGDIKTIDLTITDRTINDLAADIQNQINSQSGNNDLSVTVLNGNLQFSSASGATIASPVLTPVANAPDGVYAGRLGQEDPNGNPIINGIPMTRSFIGSKAGANDVLTKLDSVLNKVNANRAMMGAVINRLDHVINNLNNGSMNLSATRSQIEDSDYAGASTELAKTQIMQQASTAVLAQANINQQTVLKLLQV
jgi:flagellin-like hook-associated protein FlgL